MNDPRAGFRRVVLTGAAVVGLLAGCSGPPGAAAGSNGNGPGGAPGAAFTGDPCSLITTVEIEAAVGGGNKSESPAPYHNSTTESGCGWTLDLPGQPNNDTINLTVKAPGGRADFDSTRKFLQGFQGGLNSLVAPAQSLGLPGNLGISLESVPGVGDDAFIGAAGTVYAVKGDTELSIQLVAFDDPKAAQDTIDLLKKAVARLP